MDTVWHGVDEQHEKCHIATGSGFADFFDMASAQVGLVRKLLRDMPPAEWELRFDVCSPGFLYAWADIFGRAGVVRAAAAAALNSARSLLAAL